MTAKQWLSRARNIDREINALLTARNTAVDRVLSITQTMTGDTVQSTKDPHKFDQLAELEDEIEQRIDELCRVKQEIITAISWIDDGLLREVLFGRYIESKTFEEIAVAIKYSYKHTCRLHGLALLKMEDIIREYRKQG